MWPSGFGSLDAPAHLEPKLFWPGRLGYRRKRVGCLHQCSLLITLKKAYLRALYPQCIVICSFPHHILSVWYDVWTLPYSPNNMPICPAFKSMMTTVINMIANVFCLQEYSEPLISKSLYILYILWRNQFGSKGFGMKCYGFAWLEKHQIDWKYNLSEDSLTQNYIYVSFITILPLFCRLHMKRRCIV